MRYKSLSINYVTVFGKLVRRDLSLRVSLTLRTPWLWLLSWIGIQIPVSSRHEKSSVGLNKLEGNANVFDE